MKTFVLTLWALVMCTAAYAHVRITPQESQPGITQTYTARVPTEGKVATTSVQVDVPDGLTLVSVTAPQGATYEITRKGDRAVAVVWTVEIEPGTAADLSFTAKNPTGSDPIVWKAHQRYRDGTSGEWIGAAGTRAPAPVTMLKP